MCTVTVVPKGDGFRVTCNRDERDARPIATAPRRHDMNGRVAIFPEDPQGGGTWIGVNDAGLVLVILNKTDAVHSAPMRQAAFSRGLIIPSLLACERLGDAIDAVRALDAAAYDAFRLVAAQGMEVGVVTSDGCARSMDWFALVRPMLFTSSSLGDARVEEPRRRLFERMVIAADDSWLEGQARFHRHRWSDRPELSVWMERVGARTVSRSVIDVTAGGIDVHYEPLDADDAVSDALIFNR